MAHSIHILSPKRVLQTDLNLTIKQHRLVVPAPALTAVSLASVYEIIGLVTSGKASIERLHSSLKVF